jgi:hypothetical protein
MSQNSRENKSQNSSFESNGICHQKSVKTQESKFKNPGL